MTRRSTAPGALFTTLLGLFLAGCSASLERVEHHLARGNLPRAERAAAALLADPAAPPADQATAARGIEQAAIATGDVERAFLWARAASERAPEDPRLLARAADLALAAGGPDDWRAMEARVSGYAAAHLDGDHSLLLQRARLLWALGDPQANDVRDLAQAEASAAGDSSLEAAVLELAALAALENDQLDAALAAVELRAALLGDAATPHDRALLGALRLVVRLDGPGAEEAWNGLPLHWRFRLRQHFDL